MNARITTLSLGLLFAAAYAAPLLSSQLRLTPSEVDSMPAHDAGAGTSGIAGIRTTVMSGDPTQDGSYTIRVSVPGNTRIQAHTHRDDRTAVVISSVTARSRALQTKRCYRQEVSTPNRAVWRILRKPRRIP